MALYPGGRRVDAGALDNKKNLPVPALLKSRRRKSQVSRCVLNI
jgi:hypothetical protein